MMEVLSWKFNIEVPNGPSQVSQALSAKNRLAMITTEMTAIAVLSSEVSLALETSVASTVRFQDIQDKLRSQLDALADDKEFIEAFQFVITQGAGNAPYVNELLRFGEDFVDAKAFSFICSPRG